MQNSYVSMLLMLLISLWMNCFADCSCSGTELDFISCPKTYIRSDQVDICEKGIFVKIHDFVFQTEYLKSDLDGVFFENIIGADGCGPSQWRCLRVLDRGMICNTCNWDWNYKCSYCQKNKR
jgi:hypothetical protein